MAFSSGVSSCTRSLATSMALSFLLSDGPPSFFVDVGQFLLPSPSRALVAKSLKISG
ncbi:hypothetical protein [Anaplasma phagocytophilum]|uniref:hypothetical protein n=1 Tax=Anaplasma phagocytophilum TaxID=948 RepID=UPI0012DA0F46|nr:hypothetical protein [Anaplasma phagocytophilum]